MSTIATIDVTGASPYQVHIGRDLHAEIAPAVAAGQALVIHQAATSGPAQRIATELLAAGVRATLAVVPDAEEAKTTAVLAGLWDTLAEHHFSRGDAIIGVGGGAVTDLAGFVAATWMRGIKVYQVPTTLLAMVDAAVGGKTGINLPAGKNLVGAFHEPAAVFIDVEHLRTLPTEELVAGSAEIIKTGFIADETILARIEANPTQAYDIDGGLPELIERSVAVKARVVSADLKESGLREILNYGHTFGHAIEKQEHFRWRHGNAVAVGMVYAAELSQLAGLIDAPLVARHRDILSSVGLPTNYSAGEFQPLLDTMALDKKNRSGQLRFVALDGQVGAMTRLENPAPELLTAAYQAIGGVA